MKATYQWLARLIALGVVLQAAFVAYGMFGVLNAADDGKAFTGDTADNLGQSLHSTVGLMIIPLLALLLLVVSFFAKVPGGVRLAAIVVGLVVLQIVLAVVSLPVPALGLLHGVNAFALAAVAGVAGGRPGRAATAARDTKTPTAA
jgi:hypothetical protein